MNTLDIVLSVILLFAGYKGFRKGFVLEVIAILAFVLAIIGGFRLLHSGMAFIDTHFNISGEILPYLSFILIFIGIVILTNLLGRFLKKVIDMTLLGPVDNAAGAVISILKWSFGISIIFWLSNSFGPLLPDHWTQSSLLYPFLLTFAPQVVNVFSAVVPFADDLFQMIGKLLGGTAN